MCVERGREVEREAVQKYQVLRGTQMVKAGSISFVFFIIVGLSHRQNTDTHTHITTHLRTLHIFKTPMQQTACTQTVKKKKKHTDSCHSAASTDRSDFFPRSDTGGEKSGGEVRMEDKERKMSED